MFDKNLPKETYGIIKYIKDESNIKLKCSFLLKTEINLLINGLNKYKSKEWYIYAEEQIKYHIVDKIIDDINEIL